MAPIRRFVASFWAVALAIVGQAGAQESTSTLGTIERNDPMIDKLIPPGARVEKLAGGYDWSEGPVWDRKGRFLLFSDVPMNTVYRWKEGMSQPEVFLKPSGYTGTT